jgi:hypothetical protein
MFKTTESDFPIVAGAKALPSPGLVKKDVHLRATASGDYIVVSGGAGSADEESTRSSIAKSVPSGDYTSRAAPDELKERKQDPMVDLKLSLNAVMKSALGRRSYRFYLTAVTTVGSDGAGVMRQALSISPATTTYQEWSGLASLFDEVMWIGSELCLRPQGGSNGQNMNSAGGQLVQNDVWCGFDYENVSTAPVSFAAVVRLEGSQPIQRVVSDKGTMTIKARNRAKMGFARTVTPAVQDPPAGVLGSFSIANAFTLTASTVYYYATLRTIVELRCRI